MNVVRSLTLPWKFARHSTAALTAITAGAVFLSGCFNATVNWQTNGSETNGNSSGGGSSFTLNQPGNRVFPTGAVDQNTPLTLTFGSAQTGTSYSCLFDRKVDATVAATETHCTSLPGSSVSFDTASGILTWTPNTSAWGPFEIQVTATNATATPTNSSIITVVNVRSLYPKTGLILDMDAEFATLSGQATNPSTQWKDISSNGFVGTISGAELSNWVGTGVQTDPYSLSLNTYLAGTGSLIISNPLSGQSRMNLSTWISPRAVPVAGAVIATNGGGTGNGIEIRESVFYPGKVEFSVGLTHYLDTILADMPVIYWRLGDSSGASSTLDSSGNGFPGNYFGGKSTSNGVLANDSDTAISFNGFDTQAKKISVPSSFGANFTMEAWIKTSSGGSPRTIAQFGDQVTANQGATLFMTAAGYASCLLTSGSVVTSVRILLDGKWHHLVCKAVPGNLTLFVDGQFQQVAGTTSNIPSGYGFSVGANISPGNYFNGQIDEVALYNTGLSTAQIQDHYLASLPSSHMGAIFNVVQLPRPVDYWRLGESSGVTAFDIMRATNNGGYVGTYTLNQSAAPKIGDQDTSVALNGSNAFVNFPTCPTTGTIPFTVSAWIKTSASGTNQSIINYGFASASQSGFFLVNPSGYLEFNLFGQAPSNSSNVPVNDGQWHHVVAVVSTGGTIAQYYVDGTFAASTSLATLNISTCGGGGAIGRNFNSGGEYFNGKIDDVAVWDTSLSAAQIAYLYNSKTTFCVSQSTLPVSSWSMISALFDGTYASLWINGVQECVIQPKPGTFTAASSLLIASPSNPGYIAEIKIYDSAAAAAPLSLFNLLLPKFQ